MGKSTILAIAIAAAVCAMPRNASAERYYPWCAWYDAYSYSCGFTSRAQCMATISGAGGICKPNVYGPAFSDETRPRRRY
jgi:hypothetical protein